MTLKHNPVENLVQHLAEEGGEITISHASELMQMHATLASTSMRALSCTPYPILKARSIVSGAHRPTLAYRINPRWAAVAYPHLTPSPRDAEEARGLGEELVERGLLPPWTPDAHYVAAATPVVTTGSTTALAAWAAGCGADATPEVRDAVRRTLIHLGVPPRALEGL